MAWNGISRIGFAAALLGLLPGAGMAQGSALFDWGIFGSRQYIEDGAVLRTRAVGPFRESAAHADGVQMAAPLRPFYAHAEIPARDRTEWDALWPVAAGKTFLGQTSWRVLLAFYTDWDDNNPNSKYKFWIMPVWGHGRTADGERYSGLFPIGGEFRDFLFKDRMKFFLWPLWMQSQVNDVVTTDVLFPIISRTTSPDGHIEKFRVFPFYIYSKNEREFEKYAVLWPFWTHTTYTHPKASGTAWVAFPIVGRVNTTAQQGWMVLPPLFQFMKGEQMNRTYCPWPFYQRETGTHDKLYVWPFYGRRTADTLKQQFWAWPFLIRNDHTIGVKRTVRWNFVPFYSSHTHTERPPLTDEEKAELKKQARERRKAAAGTGQLTAPWPSAAPSVVLDTQEQREQLRAKAAEADWQLTGRRIAVWPLFTREYNLQTGQSRFRTLDLWPAMDPPPVERSWAPFWTLLDHRRSPQSSEWDVLWGLYRQRATGNNARDYSLFPLWRHTREPGDSARRWSLLKGLIAYDRDTTGRTTRLLWLLRFRSPAPPPSAAPE